MFITPSFPVREITRSHCKIVDVNVESIIVIFKFISPCKKKKKTYEKIQKIGPQCVLVWDFIDKVFARGFWAEANLSLTVSQLYYRGDIRPGINSLNSNFCAGIIWTNTDSQEGSGVLTFPFIKQYAFPSLPGSFLACFWTFGNHEGTQIVCTVGTYQAL